MTMRGVESALENIVASVFSRSRSTIRPVELGRRLLREIDDHRSVDVKGRRVVPNDFVIHLSPRDFAGFASFEDDLVHELSEAGRSYAEDEGYHLVGPLKVALVVDQSLKPGRFGIASQVVKAATPRPPAPPEPPAAAPVGAVPPATPDPGDAAVWAPASPDPQLVPPPPPVPVPPPPPTELAAPAAPELPLELPGELPVEAPAAAPLPLIVPLEPVNVYDAERDVTAEPPRPADAQPVRQRPAQALGVIVTPSGERVTVGHRPATIGRLPECDVTVADVNVSRRHAEIRPGTTLILVDLGSTNGTKVNGARLNGPHVLRHGDVITLGSSQLRFEASSPPS